MHAKRPTNTDLNRELGELKITVQTNHAAVMKELENVTGLAKDLEDVKKQVNLWRGAMGVLGFLWLGVVAAAKIFWPHK